MSLLPCMVPVRSAVTSFLTVATSAGTLSPAIAIQPVYDITFNLEQLAGSRVIVVPAKKPSKMLTRGSAQEENVELDIAVQHKCGVAGRTNGEIDPYMNYIETVENLCLGKALSITYSDSTTGTAVCLETEFPNNLFYEEHLRAYSVFTSVCRVTFRLNQ